MSKKKGAVLTPEAAIRGQRIRVADRKAASGLIAKILLLAAVLYVMFGVLFGITPMKGEDMQPELAAGDLILYYRLQTTYTRNDIVVAEIDGSQYVGRVIGLPGDTIEIGDDKSVAINGGTIVETQIFFPTEAFQEAVQYPLTLGPDEYFLLGDHRTTARDSRYFGTVKAEEIKGVAITAIKRLDL